MRYLLAIISIIVLIGCNINKQKNGAALKNSYPFINLVTDNKDIFGQWEMCTTSYNDRMITYNSCSIIAFNIYGTGSITNASGMQENFTWIFKNGILTISNTLKNSKNTFSDAIYKASLKNDNKSMKLQIQQISGGTVYYLSRKFENN